MTRMAKHVVSELRSGTDGHPIPCDEPPPAPTPPTPPIDPKGTDGVVTPGGGAPTDGHPAPASRS